MRSLTTLSAATIVAVVLPPTPTLASEPVPGSVLTA